MKKLLTLLTLTALALAACGDDAGSGEGGGGGGPSERSKVERAARQYVVQEQADEDDNEQAGALRFEKVDISGDSAEVVAKSSLTGNRYEIRMSQSTGTWSGRTLLTDRPDEPTQGGSSSTTEDPSQGSGREVSTDQVEQQIENRLLRLVKLDGQADCPPRVKLRRGNNFECKVTGGSRPATVTVTQKDDQGNLNFKLSTSGSP